MDNLGLGRYLCRRHHHLLHFKWRYFFRHIRENGQLLNAHLQSTRDETDYADFLKETVAMLPPLDKVIIISGQLNTHMSETLVRWIAEDEGYDEDLGVKGKCGILHNMKTRRDFLENENHRIRLVFTPKHCSWLNPIENWFAKVQRHVITNGNFSSVKELEGKIRSHIDFYQKSSIGSSKASQKRKY